MNEAAPIDPEKPAKEPPPAVVSPAPLRVMLLANEQTLRSYGPVLRRLAVGLLDEVSDLSVLSLGASELLRHVPSPPVRLITETKQYQQPSTPLDFTSRRTAIVAPHFGLVDKLIPQQRVARIAESVSRYKPVLLHALSERLFHLTRNLSRQLGIAYIVSLLALDPPRKVFSDPNCAGLLCCYSGQARRIPG